MKKARMFAGERQINLFVDKYEEIEHYIPANPLWHYGHNLRGALTQPQAKVTLPAGEMAKSLDRMGRQVIFVGTALGTIVLYQGSEQFENMVFFDAAEPLCEHGIFVRSSCAVSYQDLYSILYGQIHQRVAVAIEQRRQENNIRDNAITDHYMTRVA